MKMPAWPGFHRCGLSGAEDPCHGAVRVDGVDIATLGLHTLRRNLSLIPQELRWNVG